MKKLFALSTLVIILSGCSTAKRIEALKPEPSTNTPAVYQTTTSFVNMPVTISVSDIENQLNKFFTGLIYEDNNINDDDITLKIWKTAPIKFTEQKGRLQSILPIKISAKVKYGTTALGVSLKDVRDFDLNAIVTLDSKVGLKNWKLSTVTTLESLKWQESPTTTIAGQKVAITYLINPAVKLFKSKIEQMLDDAIANTTDFKPQVLDALQKISTPFLSNEQYEAWFMLTPVELYVTDAVLSKKQITMDMGLKCTMQTIIGQKPVSTFKKDNVVLKAVSKMPDKINVVVAGISTYENASKIMTKNFQGQEFGSGSRKVLVNKVDLWHKDGKMIIALNMSGSINGTVYLSGYPSYNATTKEIYFDKLDYVLDTKSVLMKTANWLAEGTVLRKIQENCRYSITENLEEGKKSLSPYLNNYSPMTGIFVNGNLNDFEFDKIELTDNAIIAFIKTSGKMDIKIDGLK
ncbi:DUF4403 family protein [Flavobacterium alkalisoli]|uniref:DUF4403 family protein n=1 Tax=Flavobacterium alkalisoli TaxID=2602769 RepID=A0A5B9FQF5_9FLAO|nr:DUF4403 family protein [Flavobacterium alkalisoli]QEE49204.1 DUF4403 family protein [Flavobacterium alkalisoli]